MELKAQLVQLRTRQADVSTVGAGMTGAGGVGGGSLAAGSAFTVGYQFRMTADMLRTWSVRNVWLRRMIKLRLGQLGAVSWRIGPIDPRKSYDEEKALIIENGLRRPDPYGRKTSWATLMRPAGKDVLVLDAGAIQKSRAGRGQTVGGKAPAWFGGDKAPVVGMRARDGARIVLQPAWTSDKDGPRYQFTHPSSASSEPIDNDDLIYVMGDETTNSDMGQPPLVSLYRTLLAEWDTFKSIHLVQKKRTPPGMLLLKGAGPDQVEEVQSLFEEELEGKMGMGVVGVGDAAQYVALGSVNIQSQGAFQFYDMLVRQITAAFDSTPLHVGWTQDVNRSTSQGQIEVSDEGAFAWLGLWEDYLQTEYVEDPGWGDVTNIGIQFTELHNRVDAESAQIMRTELGSLINARSINQILLAQGDPALEYDDPDTQALVDEPLVNVGGTPMSISFLAAQHRAALAAAAGTGDGAPVATGTKPEGETMPPVGGAAEDEHEPTEPDTSPTAPAATAGGKRALAALEKAQRRGRLLHMKLSPAEEITAGRDTYLAGLDELYGDRLASATAGGSKTGTETGPEPGDATAAGA